MKVTVKNKQSLMDITVESYGQIDNLVSVSDDNGLSISEALETNQELTVNNENKGDQEVKDKITTQGLSFNNDSSFDVDFDSVEIGSQEWISFNLNINDGESGIVSPNGDSSNNADYGLLYTFDAAHRIVNGINGWRLPTKSDFEELIVFLDPSTGNKLKEIGTTYWNPPNSGATNETNFNGRGAGIFVPPSSYAQFKNNLEMWTSAESSPGIIFVYKLQFGSDSLNLGTRSELFALSIRLIRE